MTHSRMFYTKKAVLKNWFIVVAMIFIIGFQITLAGWDRMSEKRWFRDATRQTPFHAVTVSALESDAGLAVFGSMIKRRCVFKYLTAYASNDKKRRATYLDVSPEEVLGRGVNRPPSKASEDWGPWIIEAPDQFKPTRWEIFVTHTCPEGMRTNLFAAGPWSSSEAGQ